MSENTKIEWATHTFNPWVGCTKISPACDHCYAEGWAKRSGQVVWGGERKRTSVANWRLPIKWNKQAELRQRAWANIVALPGCNEAACIQGGFIKPVRPKVFCASLTDVFDNAVDPQWRSDLFTLIAATPNLDWLLLTKRIGNVYGMVPLGWIGSSLRGRGGAVVHQCGWPENVWLGATICNQAEADRDIPKLLAVPAAKRFLSIEPLLGPVSLNYAFGIPSGAGRGSCPMHLAGIAPEGLLPIGQHHLHWVIVGGESGPNARPMHPDWARSLRDQCEAAGVPFLFKQWGSWISADQDECPSGPPFRDWMWADGTPFMPGDGQRAMPLFRKVSKQTAGRLLDGREWNGFPV